MWGLPSWSRRSCRMLRSRSGPCKIWSLAGTRLPRTPSRPRASPWHAGRWTGSSHRSALPRCPASGENLPTAARNCKYLCEENQQQQLDDELGWPCLTSNQQGSFVFGAASEPRDPQEVTWLQQILRFVEDDDVVDSWHEGERLACPNLLN